MLSKLYTKYQKYGFDINCKKAKYFVIVTAGENLEMEDGTTVGQYQNCKYFVTVMSAEE